MSGEQKVWVVGWISVAITVIAIALCITAVSINHTNHVTKIVKVEVTAP